MTFRITPSNVLDVVRGLVDELDTLKRQTGTVKQNTIRLGDWVLEAVDDSLVKMTNLVTGEESYIGGVSDGGTTTTDGPSTIMVIPDFPPFVISGVLKNNFGTTIKTNAYVVPYDMTVGKIVTTVAITSATSGQGPTYRIYQNGGIVYTSPEITTNYAEAEVSLTFAANDVVFLECHDSGAGDSIGLTVMLRNVLIL